MQIDEDGGVYQKRDVLIYHIRSVVNVSKQFLKRRDQTIKRVKYGAKLIVSSVTKLKTKKPPKQYNVQNLKTMSSL